jgi:hypothetical protein
VFAGTSIVLVADIKAIMSVAVRLAKNGILASETDIYTSDVLSGEDRIKPEPPRLPRRLIGLSQAATSVA